MIASAFHLVFLAAIEVVASVMPIYFLALERKYFYECVEKREVACTRARSYSRNEWQGRWGSDLKGWCTHILISYLQAWTGWQHGEMYLYLSQFLTDHEYFRDLLKTWHKVAIKQCLCSREWHGGAHIFLMCALLGRAPALPELKAGASGHEMLRRLEN